MSVVIKATNDVLVFKCSIDNEFNDVLNEIDKLLDKPMFLYNGFFPKAFFDFGCRYLTSHELSLLLELLLKKKRVLFYGMNIYKDLNKTVYIYDKTIHAGDTIKVDKNTLFLSQINKDGIIYMEEDIYFLGKVRGTLIGLNEHVHIYGHDFEHVSIRIMNHYLQDLTTFSNSMIYDNGKEIVIVKEEELWQEL
jgi:hypothetical protein